MLDRYDEREQTLYENVFRLPPGHFMIVSATSVRKEQYWRLESRRAGSGRYSSNDEYAEHFRSVFQEAVRCRLRSCGPVGSFLSGGLDSSSIVCTAGKLYEAGSSPGDGLETFSLLFDHADCNEHGYIQEVAGRPRIRANYYHEAKELAACALEDGAAYPDSAIPTISLVLPAFKDMQRKGIRTLLDGNGGDDLLETGAADLRDCLRRGRIGTFWSALRHDARFLRTSRSALALRCFKRLMPERGRAIYRRLLRRSNPDARDSWVRASWLEADKTGRRGDGATGRAGDCGSSSPRFSHAQQQIHDSLLRGWNLNLGVGMMDALASRFDVELRYPFFDRRVVEFLFAAPPEQRRRGPWRKAILRTAMAGILPETIRTRTTKGEYSAVLDRQFMETEAEHLDKLLRAPVLGELGVIRVDRLREIVHQYRTSEQVHALRRACSNFVWLETWCRSAMVSRG